MFCFLVDEGYPWLPRFIDQGPSQSKLAAFKKKIEEEVVREKFTTAEDLAYKVASSIGRFLISRKVKDELDKLPSRDSVSTPEGRSQLARRAVRLGHMIDGARVLLVNDVPAEMNHVVHLLRELNLRVDIVRSTDEALARLEAAEPYEVVISDMARDGVNDAGIRLLEKMRAAGIGCRTIFTVGRYEPERGTPGYAFGITNLVDELVNLVFDALERVRG